MTMQPVWLHRLTTTDLCKEVEQADKWAVFHDRVGCAQPAPGRAALDALLSALAWHCYPDAKL